MQRASLLDPKTLSRLATLQLRARRVVEGVLTGLHRSPHQGQAVEFAQHKEYAPGDEIRHIDWRAYARIDKHYVKKYEVETNLRAWIVLDASASMAYAGADGLSKLDYAKTLAASLAYLLVRQQDLTGLVVAGAPQKEPSAASGIVALTDERDGRLPPAVRRYVPPRASPAHLAALLDVLERLPPGGETDLAGAVDFVAEKAKGRAAVFVISDLLDASPRALSSLARLRGRRCEVSVFHLLHPDELHFPFEDPTEFLALEGGARVEAHPRAIRDGYLAELKLFLDDCRRQTGRADVDYALTATDEPLDRVLLTYLSARRGPGRSV